MMPPRKPAAKPRRPKAAPAAPAAPPTPQAIAERAYYLWLEDPVANGDPVANWTRAEQELSTPTKKAPARRKKSPPA